MNFFNYIKKQHTNIIFSFETEKQNQLPFLDTLLIKSHDTFTTSTYQKPTYTGLLTNYFSFTPLSYKTGLIRTLIDRAYKIDNTNNGFQQDVKNITSILLRNSFPLYFINKTVKRYLHDKTKTISKANIKTSD